MRENICLFFFFFFWKCPGKDFSPTHHHISPLTMEVVRAPQITLQPFHPSRSSAAFMESPTPFPSIPWCYLPISSVFLSLLLSLSPAELRILRCGHTIFTMVRRSSCTPIAFWMCCKPPRSSHGLCRKCSEVCYSISSRLYPSLYFCIRIVNCWNAETTITHQDLWLGN